MSNQEQTQVQRFEAICSDGLRRDVVGLEDHEALLVERDLLLAIKLDYLAQAGDYLDYPEHYPAIVAHDAFRNQAKTKPDVPVDKDSPLQRIREGKVSKGGRNDPPVRPRPTGRPQAEPPAGLEHEALKTERDLLLAVFNGVLSWSEYLDDDPHREQLKLKFMIAASKYEAWKCGKEESNR